MPRSDFIQAPTQVTGADNAIAALKFDAHWLLELSNADPASVARRIDELYSIMNIIQLVTSRFARVCNDTSVSGAAAPAAGRSMASEQRAEQRNPGGGYEVAPNVIHAFRKSPAQDEPEPERAHADTREQAAVHEAINQDMGA